MSGNELIVQAMRKLGMNIDKKLISKTSELVRLAESKSTGLKCGDYAKTVVLLDLATGVLGMHIDTEEAVKISSLRKADYNRTKRTLEKVLDIIQTIDIPKICVQLGLSHVQKTSEQLLNEYKTYTIQNSTQDLDLTHPQYAAMAIYQACKLEKQRILLTKLLPFSNLKPAQWEKLKISWEVFLSQRKNTTAKGSQADQPSTSAESNVKYDTAGASAQTKPPETYEMWRKNIIEKAFKQLVATKNLCYLHINILKTTLDLDDATYERAVKYFKDFCRSEEPQTAKLLEPKYACVVVLKSALETGTDIDMLVLTRYSQLNKVEFRKFVKEWNDDFSEFIDLEDDEPDIKPPKFNSWYNSTFGEQIK